MIWRMIEAAGDNTLAVLAPWLVLTALALWTAAIVVRLLRRLARLQREVAALARLATLLAPAQDDGERDTSLRVSATAHPRRSPSEQLLALRGIAALEAQAARTAAEWLLLARNGHVAGRSTPELVQLGLAFALDREVQALLRPARSATRQLLPLSLAMTACGLVGAAFVLASASTRTPPLEPKLAAVAPVLATAITTVAVGFFLGCGAFTANRLAHLRLQRLSEQLSEAVSEVELLALRM